MKRKVTPELLDALPADDYRAIQSRLDLRRVNWWMGHFGAFTRMLSQTFPSRPPASVVELGAGDGSLLLRLATKFGPTWKPDKVTLVERQSLLTPETREKFAALGWPVAAAQGDVFDWLDRSGPERYDLGLANLFLHHFKDDELRRLLGKAAQQSGVFLACEPRRSHFTLGATRLLPLLGCNDVSIEDGRTSVRAGFAGNELSRLWLEANRLTGAEGEKTWRLLESPAGPFSHTFMAY